MAEGKIIRKGGGGKQTAAPSITVVSTSPTGVTFTLTNNDDNTAIISYDIDTTQGAVELATTATSSNITVALSAGTYTLTAYATVVGEVATQSTAAVEIVVIEYELLGSVTLSSSAGEINFTGLNITKDDELRIVYTWIGDSPTAERDVFLFPNDLSTYSNYHSQRLAAGGSTLFHVRENNCRIGSVQSDLRSQGFVDIKISNNDRFVAQSQHLYGLGADSSGMFLENRNVVSSGLTLTTITKLTIRSSNTTSGFATGTKATLYKVNTGAA